ncbi:hypothetical protein LTR86_002915 [Recurvomyces mirabilis]|nr:hypothetical protein LTR86_002915 [Recurvomyces mirabilis]
MKTIHSLAVRCQLNASSYAIIKVDVRNVSVFPNGSLTCPPAVKQIASLPHAALPNGIALTRPLSDNLLVAGSLRGLIWNVDICNGTVGVALNDTTTKGSAPTGAAATGVNGLKVHDGMMYYTSTGANKFYKVPVDELGIVSQVPTLIAANLTCDDLVIDHEGTAYVAGPLDVLTKVSPSGEQTIIAGTINSNQVHLWDLLLRGLAVWHLIGGVCTSRPMVGCKKRSQVRRVCLGSISEVASRDCGERIVRRLPMAWEAWIRSISRRISHPNSVDRKEKCSAVPQSLSSTSIRRDQLSILIKTIATAIPPNHPPPHAIILPAPEAASRSLHIAT